MNRALIAAALVTITYVTVGFWGCLAIVLMSCIFLKSKDLLIFCLYLSFFNFTAIDDAPWWAGVCGCILVLCAYAIKNPKTLTYQKQNKLIYYSGISLVALLIANYFALSAGSIYEKTAIKSLIQQIVFVGAFVFFLSLNATSLEATSINIRKELAKFIVFYTAIFFADTILTGDSVRFGGGIGPQALAFLLTLTLVYFALIEKNIPTSILIILITSATQSRTYLGLQIAILLLMFVKKEKKYLNKIVYSCGGAAVGLGIIVLLPFISQRLNYHDDDFLGSLLGRLSNYDTSMAMISANPFWGSGVGSIVNVLENWVLEFYEYYLSSGDTTIIHNEYLRILTELGIAGLFLYAIFMYGILNSAKGEAKLAFTMIFLIGSIVENTLALYSGPIIALAFFVCTPKAKAISSIGVKYNDAISRG